MTDLLNLPNISYKNFALVGAAKNAEKSKIKLFEPLTIKNITLKNRLIVAPM